MTIVIAAGNFAGKPPRMTDKAFKPPTDAAMAMTGKDREVGVVGRAPLAAVFCRGAGLDFVFAIRLATAVETASSTPARLRAP